MNDIADNTQHEDAEPKPVRQTLGRRDKTAVNLTLLRVVGKETKTPPLDVAASQSFAD